MPKGGVVTVGDGRGFVIEGPWQHRYIVTAAHCLPSLPPAHAASYSEERTYWELVGPLGQAPSICVECCFVDPVADIAVLCSPDAQSLFDEADAYEDFTASATALDLADARAEIAQGQLLSISGAWFGCEVHCHERALSIRNAAEPIKGGMSGSPILDRTGKAIGVVVNSAGGIDLDGHTEGGPCPRLLRNLPVWLAREFLGAD